ncbi:MULTISPECIES: hypothetical protein [Shewanella]|jgi:hypothetical protein|uniref:Uncharacterized protein n=1 Tax=Shewanella indica TaxID=768528 RepID=A0ABU4QIC8_9GAMM|nr:MULTISPECIES: hypothetical protein [Shewanella]MDX6017096.1 hypothetical protein [Shewanella indica]
MAAMQTGLLFYVALVKGRFHESFNKMPISLNKSHQSLFLTG